jgi:hypothetical protein
MKVILIIFIIICFILLKPSYSFALSEYGLKCDNNPDCVKCRDEIDSLHGLECQECMHRCWNLYGPAEFDDVSKKSRDKKEQCRLKWAKWCNAQCWDPDDKENPDYVSSKPLCNSMHVFPKYDRNNPRPW